MSGPFDDTSDDGLVNYVIEHRELNVQTAAVLEMQKRSIVAIREFNVRAGDQIATLIKLAEQTSEQTDKLVMLTKATGEQTERVIDLTGRLSTLTVIITVLTAAAVVFGAIQAIAIVVHFYRWYRGWL
jgi:hypothetical protein